MNILEIEDMVKGLPDQALQKEAKQPTGRIPQFLVVSEIQRRGDMRQRFQKRQENQGTVKDQVMQQGIAAMGAPQPEMQALAGGPSMPPQGMPPQGMQQPMPPQAMPQGMPPQMPPQMPMQQPPMGMYGGGVVEMFDGGMTELEKAAAALYDYQRPMVSRGRSAMPDPNSLSREELILQELGQDYSGFMPPALPGMGAKDKFIDQASARLLELENMLEQETEDDAQPLMDDSQPLMVTGNQQGDVSQSIYSDSFTRAALEPKGNLQDLINIAGSNAAQEDASNYNLDGSGAGPLSDEIVIPGINQQPLLDAQQRLREQKRSVADLRMADAEEVSRRYQELVTAVQDQKMPTIDYSPLRQKQEQFLEEQMGKLRKETGAQTLIALGAGIARGDLAGGLSEAGKQAAASSAQRRALEAKNRAIQLGFDQAEIENQQKAAIKKEENRLRGIELSIKGFEKVGATRAAAEQFAIVSDLPLEQAIATLNQSRELQQAKLRGDLVKQEELVAREVERATTAALNLLPPGAARDTDQLLILRNQIRDSIMSAHPVLSDRVPKTTDEKTGEGNQSGLTDEDIEDIVSRNLPDTQ